MWPFSSRKPRTTAHTQRHRNSFHPCLEILEDRCLLSGGVLDPTFGTGGIVNHYYGNLNQYSAVATYPQEGTLNDGKIVVAGPDSGAYGVVRYNLDGKLDYSFGSYGLATTKIGTNARAYAVAVQPDGKVLVAGYPDLVRYNANGSLDTTFGKNGEAAISFANTAQAMILQPDGKIVVVGVTTNALALARYNANGSLDASFGKGGTETVPFASQFDIPKVALDAGTGPLDPNAGKIIVAGEVGGNVVVVRFNSNGGLDASFGTGGVSSTVLPENEPPALAVQSDDRIVVMETGNLKSFDLVRLNPDGTPDATFGSGGFANPTLPFNFTVASSVAIQADGRIVVAGAASGNVVLAHYNAADGSLDASFGNNGIAVAAVTSSKTLAETMAMALEPDGRIVVTGNGSNANGVTTFVVRYLATGPQIGSFTANPNPATAGSNVTLTAANVAALNPNTTVKQVAFYTDSNGDGKLEPGTDALLGYAVQTSPGSGC